MEMNDLFENDNAYDIDEKLTLKDIDYILIQPKCIDVNIFHHVIAPNYCDQT